MCCVFYSSKLVSIPLTVEPELYNISHSNLTISRVEEQSVTFECTANAIPIPRIVWIANGRLVDTSLNDRYTQKEEVFEDVYQRPEVPNAIRSSLNITMLNERDSGDYVCRAEIALGQPAILPQPFTLNITKSK